MNKWWWFLLIGAGLWILFRKPLETWYNARTTGLQAAADAATANGYTTYNTQLYSAPRWRPFLNFFKVGAYVPPRSGGGQPEQVNYSVQG